MSSVVTQHVLSHVNPIVPDLLEVRWDDEATSI